MDSTNGGSPQRGLGPDEADEAFARLRAADPAADVEPDLTAIRAAVAASVAADGAVGATPVADGADNADAADGSTVVDLAAARSRRRPARWLQVAAAAVGIAAVGTAGYALGSQDGGAGVTADGEARASVESGTAAGAPQPLTMPMGEEAAVAADRAMLWGFGTSRTLFTAVGLDDTPTTATAWGYDTAAAFAPETAAALAGAVGLEGEPALHYGSWHIGSTDWTGPTLDVQPDAATSFSFYDPTFDPWAEGATATAVDGADATARLAEIMTAVGVDPAGFDLVVEDTGTTVATTVSAYRADDVVGDGQTWQLTVSSEGISSLYGALAPLVDLGSYDVVGPATAVARLTDPRFGATADYGVMPLARGAVEDGMSLEMSESEIAPPLEYDRDAGATLEMIDPGYGVDSTDVAPEDPTAVPTLPPSAVPGSTFAWPVAEVAITGAELTTTAVHGPDGSVAIVPAYRLSGDDGSTWTVIAVTEDHLDFAAR